MRCATIDVTVLVAPETPAQQLAGSATVSSTTADPNTTDNRSSGSLEVVVDAVSQGPVPVPQTPSEPGTLPETGGSTTVTLATAAVLFLLAGATALVPSRRRRRGDGQLDV